MYLRPFAIGALSFCPGVKKLVARRGTGAPASAEYSYGIWLKHLTMLWRSGMRQMPETVAELGPGQSLGVGLAALLCGVKRYYALDVTDYSAREANVRIFDDLVTLLRQREPRPHKGWPDYDQWLDERLFPSHVLTDTRLDAALAPSRIAAIRSALLNDGEAGGADPVVEYIVPWNDAAVIATGSVDLVLSHVVLQAVDDLDSTYAALHQWLRPGGWMSHHIDFTSQRTASNWNGHWAYSEAARKVISGRRPSFCNREPHSTHLSLLQKYDFEVVLDLQNHSEEPGITRARLARRWRRMSDEDLSCCAVFSQARKALAVTARAETR